MPTRAMYADLLGEFADMVAERVAAKMAGGVTSKTESRLISVQEAAERMGVTVKAMRHLMTTREFPKHAIRRFGRKILIERPVFDQWLSAH